MMEIFFDYPSKQWHFNELKKKAKLADSKLSKWLKRFMNKNLIKRIKEKGKMPYYLANYEAPQYQNTKRIFAMNMLNDAGFLNHLSTLNGTVILFGSITRWDWHKDSDIDLFIYGDSDDLEIGKFQSKLNREIQIFTCKNKDQLKKMNNELISSIIKGDLIKGDLDFVKVSNA